VSAFRAANPPVALRWSDWQSRSEPHRFVNQLVDVEMGDAGRMAQALSAALVDLLEQQAPNWYGMAHWMNWKHVPLQQRWSRQAVSARS